MNTKILFVLLLLPGLAQAVICKTVGPDGVISFTDVPAAECPPGAAIPDPAQRAAPAERAERVETGIGGRAVFPGYRSIAIESPEDGGTVRSNEGRVPVTITLEPGLQSDHFITVYLDGKAFRGRYGSAGIELSGIDRGTHKLWVTVTDAKGQTLIESKKISFTLLQAIPLQVREVRPTLVSGVFLGGPGVVGAEVTIRFPNSTKVYKGVVTEQYAWTVAVEGEPLVEGRFDVQVRTRGGVEFKRSQDINPSNWKGGPRTFEAAVPPTYAPGGAANYRPEGDADYTPREGGISTTPGQANPAFQPKYTR